MTPHLHSAITRLRSIATACFIGFALVGCPQSPLVIPPTPLIAQEWNQLTREAIAVSTPRPTVHSRNLFHVSLAAYEAWAAYDPRAVGYLTGSRYKQPHRAWYFANRAESISHAVYVVLNHHFATLANSAEGTPQRDAFDAFREKMQLHGYLDENGAIVPSEAQGLGTLLGQLVLQYGAEDESNEANGFADTSGYAPSNPPLIVAQSGTNGITDINAWQPLQLPNAVSPQTFLTPHWGEVDAFALPPFSDMETRLPVADPPRIGEPNEQEYFDAFVEVLRFSSRLDPTVGGGANLLDISPGSRGNNSLGRDDGNGHALNPYTQTEYPANGALWGDYFRAISEFWADGPKSETPPGHWNEIATDVMRGTGIVDERAANKFHPGDLDYDVKLYFALNAALYDAAIATWDVKHFYDYVRPISAIRALAEQNALSEVDGFIEEILVGDPLAGPNDENVGKLKVLAWQGPNLGVDWILGEDWLPYQAEGFVTPAFPGYTSGHSCFSRAAAEVLTHFTGDPFFPGGIAEYTVASLAYETTLSAPVTLQWATYYDAADEAGISRRSGGIHHYPDDYEGRTLGSAVGLLAYEKAEDYFEGRGVAVMK